MIFATRLKEIRKEKDYTQSEFAARIGVSSGLVSLWESEQRVPSLSSLIAIADSFDVSIDYLVGRTDEPAINR